MRIIKIIKNLDIPKFVIIMFVLGLILRVVGIWFGLPLQLNIDEPTLVSSVIELNTNLNPGRFEWPHLYYYINFIFYVVFVLLRKVITIFYQLPEVFYTASPFFLISRSLSAIFGSLTIISVYYISKDIFSKKVAYLSAFIMAILPVSVYESHLAKVDTANAFFTSIAVYFMWQVFKKGKLKSYILSGLWIGLATSIKYNGALLFFPLLIAHFLQKKSFGKKINVESIKSLVISGLVSIAAFYAGTPFALFDYKKFFSTERNVGAMWQIKNIGSIEWEQFPTEIYNTFVTMYQEHLGFGLWIIFMLLITLFLFFNKRSREYIFLVLPIVFFSLYISRFDRSPGHYFLFLIPFYVPAFSGFIIEIIDFVTSKITFFSKNLKVRINPKIIYGFILSLIFIPSIWSVVESDILLAREDTRISASKWVSENLDQTKDFLYVNGEELKSVSFQKKNTEKIKKVDRGNIKHPAPFYLVMGVENISLSDVTTGNKDPDKLSGNSEPILENAILELAVDNKWRLGPPIYIFKVLSVRDD